MYSRFRNDNVHVLFCLGIPASGWIVCVSEVSGQPCVFLFAEVIADATKAIDSVLKADTKRIELLEEEKRLTKLVNEGNIETEVSDKLQQVCIAWMGRGEGGVGSQRQTQRGVYRMDGKG